MTRILLIILISLSLGTVAYAGITFTGVKLAQTTDSANRIISSSGNNIISSSGNQLVP